MEILGESWMKFLGKYLFMLSLTIPGGHGAAVAETVDAISLEDLRVKYANSDSQYMDVDGIEIHYKDQGSGPPVVLLHASYFNLRAWDGLTDALKDDFRVIRFDFPAVGLSGMDTKKKESMKRNEEVLGQLVDALGLESFSLVGTSSGGIVAFRYASKNPERITRFVLINSAGMPRTAQTDPNRSNARFEKYQDMPLKPQAFWEESLDVNFIDPNEPPDWVPEMLYDVHRRDDFLESTGRFVYKTGDPQTELAKIQSPTLIMWGKNNPTVVHLEADVFQHWMTGAPSVVKKYPGTGHYPYLEKPKLLEGDIRVFLLGEMDDELRQTQMARPSDL